MLTQTAYLIPNVPPLKWGMEDITFAGKSSAAATAPTSNPWRYTDILGVTALAFRTRWYITGDERGWDGAAPIAEEREEVALVEGLGWRLRPLTLPVPHPTLSELALNPQSPSVPSTPPAAPKPQGKALHFRRQIVASLDAGLPVLCKDRKSLDMGVIYGYEAGGEVMILSDYWGHDFRVPLAELWPFFLLLQPTEPVDPLVAAQQALTFAVQNWRRAPVAANEICLWGNHTAGATYFYGDQAYTRWIEDLAAVDGEGEELGAEQQGQLFHCTWWNIDCWVSARHAAQEYLGGLIPHVDGTTGQALQRAVHYYSEQCRRFHATVPPQGSDMAFFGPWSGKGIAQWTPDVRANEQAILAELRDLDAQATAELAAALATWPKVD